MHDIAGILKKSFSGISFLFGYGFILAVWKWSDIELYSFFQLKQSLLIYQIFFAIGLLFAALLCGFVLKRSKYALSNRAYFYSVYIALFAIIIEAVLIHANIWPISQDTAALSGIIFGYAIGGNVLLWVERFGFFSVTQVIAGLAVAYAICLVLFLYLLDMTPLFAGVTALCCPLLSVIFISRTKPASSAEQKTFFTPMKASKNLELLIWMVLATFLYQVAQGYGREHLEAVEFFQVGSLIPVVLVVLFLCLNLRKVGFLNMYRTSLAFIFAGLIVLYFLKDFGAFGEMLVGSAYFVVVITLLVVVASYAKLSNTSAARGYIAVIISNFIGAFLSGVAPIILSNYGIEMFGDNATFLMLAIVFLLLAPFAFRKESNLFTYFGTVDSALESDVDSINDATICESLGQEYQLTSRETSILYLHIKGFSQANITEELFIAEGTVRAHYNNIYRKLSVHSREELDELVSRHRADMGALDN